MLILAGGGVPWDVALKWSPVRRFAAVIALGELKGGTFNWDRLEWEREDA
jgi:hypothetical protein